MMYLFCECNATKEANCKCKRSKELSERQKYLACYFIGFSIGALSVIVILLLTGLTR